MTRENHGLCNTRLYSIWQTMKQRCGNPKRSNYKYYGKKGITVCEEWQNSFLAFREWAINNGYSDRLTIDRIDLHKGYSPENCRWATPKQQQNNISTNRKLSYYGETHTVMQWAEKYNISANMIYKRIYRGWDVERALTTKNLKIGG